MESEEEVWGPDVAAETCGLGVEEELAAGLCDDVFGSLEPEVCGLDVAAETCGIGLEEELGAELCDDVLGSFGLFRSRPVK